MYDVYLNKVLLPIPPSKIKLKIKNQNKTITLIDEGEVNLLKSAGLTDITFSALLPNIDYPFSNGGNASSILDELEKLKKKKSFQFIVSRVLPNGKVLFNTNIKVSLEDYDTDEDTKNGFDIMVNVALKQYKSYGTKIIEIKPPTPSQPKLLAKVEPKRPVDKSPAASHKVVKGDCLWNIAQKMLGDGSRYPEIYELNKATIDAGNKGTGNTKYTIYPNQVFVMPSK